MRLPDALLAAASCICGIVAAETIVKWVWRVWGF